MASTHARWISVASCLMALAAPPLRAADDPGVVAKLIADLQLQEDSTPVRERKSWRPPKKIVVIGPSPGFASVAPGVEIVNVADAREAAAAAVDADVVVGLNSAGGACEREIVDNAKELRWMLVMSAGVERCIGIESLRKRDILVTNLRAVESAAIAEHAIAFAYALARGMDTFVMSTANARWNRGDAQRTQLQVLHGKTMLVVGLGGIGTEVAKRAHGIGMKVIATRASGRKGPEYVSYVGLPDELMTLAKQADVIVNTAPLTEETKGIFDAKFFASLKPSAFFINVARGGSVVTSDLVDALNKGVIAGAGLDVVDPEPLPSDHPLWRAPNVIISPHISSGSDLPREQRWILARENLRRYVAGEKMLSVVDVERGY
jgi:phosphoglycerate dehydrogenase-like enzyme